MLMLVTVDPPVVTVVGAHEPPVMVVTEPPSVTVTVAVLEKGWVQPAGVFDVDGVTVIVVKPPGEQVVPGPLLVIVTVLCGSQVGGLPPLVTVTVRVGAGGGGGGGGQEVTPLTGVVPVHALQEDESRATSGLALASRLRRVSKLKF